MNLNMDDEVLVLFIEEAREHLNGIEGDLLDIEAMGDILDKDLVNKVFRAIHSIKGGAGFWGLENVKNLSHEMENILNQIRNGERIPDSPIISALLDGADLLSIMINNLQDSELVDITSVMSALNPAAKAVSAPKPQTGKKAAEQLPQNEPVRKYLDIANASGDIIFSIPTDRLNQSRKGGKYLYYAECDLMQDIKGKGKPLEDLIDELLTMGELIESYTNVEEVGMLDVIHPDAPVPYHIVFSSIVDPDMIDSVIRINIDHIIFIDENNRLQPIGDGIQVAYAPEEVLDIPEAMLTHNPESAKSVQPKTQQESAPVKQAPKTAPAASPSATTLRVQVSILDHLINLAGELVLSRNQLKQAVLSKDLDMVEKVNHQINRVTSELQERIMQTRLQPIDLVFNKFNRVVRDMSRDLGKEVDLIIEGKDVELDKGIIEGIADPMTHLVRNALDHGLETPDERRKMKKTVPATLKLKAFHEAGQVYLEIIDDGRGIDPAIIREKAIEKGLAEPESVRKMSDKEVIQFIFAPGFSTAKQVTDISGRGVGMDVVKSNLNQLGGVVDIISEVNKGTTIRIKLPLTLAIIPSLIVGVAGERFAIPQVNLVELVRIPAGKIQERLEQIHKTTVMRLRGQLLPVIYLEKILGIPNDSQAEKAVQVLVISAGELKYGLVVDELLDTEEIVVKPLGKHLRVTNIYAGATILGDGQAALILDVVNISRNINLKPTEAEPADDMLTRLAKGKNAQSLVIVKNSKKEYFAIPLGLITRIERISREDLEDPAGQLSIKYRDGNLLLFRIEDVAKVSAREDVANPFVVVFPYSGREVGILVSHIVDAVDVSAEIDEETFQMPGILGSAIILGHTTMLLDVYAIVSGANPDLARKFENRRKKKQHASAHAVLVVEDSAFFRNNMANIVKEAGYECFTAEDGVLGLEQLKEHGAEIAVVLTDIEMPNMDGLEMTRRIRAQKEYLDLPVIACTSLAGEMAEKRGYEAGIDQYLVKLDREKVTEAIHAKMNEFHAKEQVKP